MMSEDQNIAPPGGDINDFYDFNEAARAETRATTAERAAKIWEQAVDDPEHPYLTRKQIAAHGTKREDRTNFLLVPLHDADGALQNLQRIDPAGEKRFLKGGVKQG